MITHNSTHPRPPAPITTHHHDTLDLGYLRAGNTGPVVVMLHGWGAFKELWWSTLGGLGHAYRCYALDVPGHGDSPIGQTTTLREVAETVIAFCDDLDLAEIALFGHSMGGAVAAEVAFLRPDLVRRMVLVDAAIDAHLMPFYARIYLLPTFGWALLRTSQALGRALRPLSTQVPHNHGGGFLRPWMRRTAYLAVFDPEGLYRIYRSLFATRAGMRLREISVATLVVTGQFDSLVPTANSRRLARLIPGAQYAEIPGARHNPMDERPRTFQRTVQAFLDAG